MPGTIAEALLLSLGVAISPIPILGVVALLLSERPRPTGLGFSGGWMGGIVVVVSAATAFALFSDRLGDSGLLRQSAAAVGVVLGALAIAAGVAVWMLQPPGAEARQPRWLAALDQMSVRQAVVLGAALSAVNPKNLLASVVAGLMIGWSGLSTQVIAASAAAFSLIASSSVLLPMLAFRLAGRAIRGRLTIVRDWLIRHNAGVVSLVLIVIGALLVVRGLSGA